MQIQVDIADLVDRQIKSTLEAHLGNIDLSSMVSTALTAAVNSLVAQMAIEVSNKLTKRRDLDQEVRDISFAQSKEHIQRQASIAARQALGSIDITSIIESEVRSNLNANIENYSFPHSSIPANAINWKDISFSGDVIKGGTLKDFNSNGIQDRSTSCQLTIIDGMVVVEDQLVTRHSRSDLVEARTLKVDQKIELGEAAQQQIHGIIKSVISSQQLEAWPLDDSKIVANNGRLILDKNTLGPSVMTSNLRRLGALEDLKVTGAAKFSETMLIGEHRRVGINTEEPAGALSIWDDDAEITIARQSPRNMFVGSTRQSNLSLGTNFKSQVTITPDGAGFADPVTVQGIRFSVEDSVPDRVGQPLEIAMVRNATPGQPRFYICEGGNRWSVLGAIA